MIIVTFEGHVESSSIEQYFDDLNVVIGTTEIARLDIDPYVHRSRHLRRSLHHGRDSKT